MTDYPKLPCKLSRRKKVCTPAMKMQMNKYRKRGWTFLRIAEKFGISQSAAHLHICGEPKRTTELRNRLALKYYHDNAERLKKCIWENQKKRRAIPGYGEKLKEYEHKLYIKNREHRKRVRAEWIANNKEYVIAFSRFTYKYGRKKNFPQHALDILKELKK